MKPVIEAKCRDCGQEIAEGCVPYRTLDAFGPIDDPYCPNTECESDDLEFFETEKARD